MQTITSGTYCRVMLYAAAALSMMFALFGWVALSGVRRRGWVHMYRQDGRGVGDRQLVWTAAYGGGGVMSALLSVAALVDGATIVGVVLGGLGMIMLGIGGWVRRRPVPAWLKPRWLRDMEADSWTGYWGDDADRRAGTGFVRLWISLCAVVVCAFTLAVALTSTDWLTWAALSFGVANFFRSVAYASSRRG